MVVILFTLVKIINVVHLCIDHIQFKGARTFFREPRSTVMNEFTYTVFLQKKEQCVLKIQIRCKQCKQAVLKPGISK